MDSNEYKFPSVYVVGTQKGGTTSLHFLLQSHKRLFFPSSPQELHYFDIEENYRKGPAWFSNHFIDAPNDAVLVQTSPLYMYLKKVPSRIAETKTPARFIFILRNPIDRAYSHYWNSVKYGFESLSFEDALSAESKRIKNSDEHQRNFSYLDRGYYTAQVQRYIDLFGKSSILLLTQDELKSSEQLVKQKIATFLDIDVNEFEQSHDGKIHNSAKLPRSKRIQRLRPSLDNTSFKLPVRLLDKCNLVTKNYPLMNPVTRKKLHEAYSEELEKLSELFLDGIDYQVHWH